MAVVPITLVSIVDYIKKISVKKIISIFSKKLLRSVEESEMFRNRGKKFREDYVNPPIFSFIKFENCHHCSNGRV